MKKAKFAVMIAAFALASTALWSCKRNETERRAPVGQDEDQAPTATAPGEGDPGEEQAQDETMRGEDQTMTRQQFTSSCPMVVEGVDVEMTETDNGVALAFTTTEGDVSDLRQRVQRMARMYEMHAGRGSIMWKHMEEGHMEEGHMDQGQEGITGEQGLRERPQQEEQQKGMQGQQGQQQPGALPETKATVAQIDKGARLELMPADSAQLQKLRTEIRQHQQRMRAGECWMPHEQQQTVEPRTRG